LSDESLLLSPLTRKLPEGERKSIEVLVLGLLEQKLWRLLRKR